MAPKPLIEPEADAERLALDRAVAEAVRLRIAAGPRPSPDGDAIALRDLLTGRSPAVAATVRAVLGRIDATIGAPLVVWGPASQTLAADRFGLTARTAAEPEQALASVRDGARALLDLTPGKAWWGRLLAEPALRVVAALPDDCHGLPRALMVQHAQPGPTGDDRTFWATDSKAPDARIVETLAASGLAASPLIAAGGLKLFMLAGYVQAEDGRLASAPGSLSGVIGAAPQFDFEDRPMTDAPAPKPGILDIAPYVGGKSRIEGVAEPMKLSSNENALGAGEKAREAYAAAIGNIHMYPDGRATKLRDAVAEHHGLEPERLIFGNGSDEVFALLNQTYLTPGDNIVSGQYGFLAYRMSALANQASVKLAPEPGFRAEVDALLGEVDDRTRIVYVSSPSNPTGSYNTAGEIRRLHEALPPHILLVIDEAYAEFVAEPDWETSFPLAREHDNIVVTRTFSKIHGLGGLRIGFGYAPLKVAEAVDRIRLPFNVSVPGLEAAVAALGDEAHQKASRDLVHAWRPRLTQAIKGFGFDVFPSAGNFVLVRFPDGTRNAAAANDYLNSKGIIVRPVGGYGLPDCLRITVGTEDQNRAVIDALSEFAAAG